jgi:DNA topoisomerase I
MSRGTGTIIEQERAARPAERRGRGTRDVSGAAAGPARCRPDRRPPTGPLYYVCEQGEGITRERSPDGFMYRHPSHRVVRNPATLERIRRLAIPPAWTGVWICADPDGHIQATGRDAKGRKQYRYHPAWREMRETGKFERLAAFGRALPSIRGKAQADLARPDLSKEKVLALVILLMDQTLLRVGNEEYARQNEAYGLTTLRDRHAFVCGADIRLVFRGKGGKTQLASIRNRRLARVVRRSQELPGEVLFQYLDADGRPVPVTSGDVNEYLRAVAGEAFSAKDFRTWGGTLIAARELAQAGGVRPPAAAGAAADLPPAGRSSARESGAQARSDARRVTARVNQALDVAAAHLGNTRAVARRSYVHPGIIASFLDGSLAGTWTEGLAVAAAQGDEAKGPPSDRTDCLSSEEQALLTALERIAPGS